MYSLGLCSRWTVYGRIAKLPFGLEFSCLLCDRWNDNVGRARDDACGNGVFGSMFLVGYLSKSRIQRKNGFQSTLVRHTVVFHTNVVLKQIIHASAPAAWPAGPGLVTMPCEETPADAPTVQIHLRFGTAMNDMCLRCWNGRSYFLLPIVCAVRGYPENKFLIRFAFIFLFISRFDACISWAERLSTQTRHTYTTEDLAGIHLLFHFLKCEQKNIHLCVCVGRPATPIGYEY